MRSRDDEIIDFLHSHPGAAMSDIKPAFSPLSRSALWHVLRRLEKQGLIWHSSMEGSSGQIYHMYFVGAAVAEARS